jgi:hypothetical protein
MHSKRNSADCHLGLNWLPPDQSVSKAPNAPKDRMPHVIDGPDGPRRVLGE